MTSLKLDDSFDRNEYSSSTCSQTTTAIDLLLLQLHDSTKNGLAGKRINIVYLCYNRLLFVLVLAALNETENMQQKEESEIRLGRERLE